MTKTKKLIIGTRGSDLALWQANYLQSKLTEQGIASELHIVKTRGDKDLRPLKDIAGDGFFTKDLENKLLENEIDLAIHSAKDLASLQHHEIPWKALGPRETTRDVIICKKELLHTNSSFSGSTIGTSSPRRRAQIKDSYPKAEYQELRGNVPTRLSKVSTGEYDAVVLAEAGLKRLGLIPEIHDSLACIYPDWTTAPCQGILAVQGKRENLKLIDSVLDPTLSEIAYLEKSILAFLGGGCHMAVGAKIHRESINDFQLRFALEKDNTLFKLEKSYGNLHELKTNLFNDIHNCLNEKNFHGNQQLVLTHSLSNHLKVMDMASSKKLKCLSLPQIEIASTLDSNKTKSFIESWDTKSSLIFTSQYAVRIFMMEFYNQAMELELLEKMNIYCIGQATKDKLSEFKVLAKEVSWEANSKSFVGYILDNKTEFEKIYFVGSKDSVLTKQLKDNNISFEALYVYTNRRPDWFIEPISLPSNSLVSFASPSSVKNFILEHGADSLKNHKVFAMGPSTGNSLSEHNIVYTEVAKSGSWESIIEQSIGE